MTDAVFTVAGIPFGGVDALGTKWNVQTEQGWYGGVGVRSEVVGRPFAHGEFDPPRYRAGRTIVIGGTSVSSSQAAAIQAGQRLTGTLGEGIQGTLSVTDAVGTLSSVVRVDDSPLFAWVTDSIFSWQLSLHAADPRKYGVPGTVGPITLAVATGGLVTPLFMPSGALSWGTLAAPQNLTLSNPGTADGAVSFTVSAGASALLGGFQIIETTTGRILRYVDDLAAGQFVVFNSANTSVLLNGDTDRRGSVTVAQWTPVPAVGSRTFYLALLSGTSTTATISATTRPTYW